MAKITCSVESWPIKEVVVPDLPLPFLPPRISSNRSITSNRLHQRPQARCNRRRAPTEDISTVLL